MSPHGAVLGLVLLATIFGVAPEAPAQDPTPRVRERPEATGAAFRLVEEARWPEAVEAFALAVRESPGPLPAEALRRWGVAAFEAGRPLAAYVRLGQYLAGKPLGADREAAIDRIGRAREALLLEAARFSRLVTTVERRLGQDSVPERDLARVAARDGDVSLEGMSGPRLGNPTWRRAEEIPAALYLDLVRRILEMPVLIGELPPATVDPNDGGPQQVADRVLEFARAVPRLADFEAKATPAPGAPAKPGRKRR